MLGWLISTGIALIIYSSTKKLEKRSNLKKDRPEPKIDAIDQAKKGLNLARRSTSSHIDTDVNLSQIISLVSATNPILRNTLK
jgi:hypothetical protein